MPRVVKANHEAKKPTITTEDEDKLNTLNNLTSNNEVEHNHRLSDADHTPDISFVKSPSAAVYRAGLNPSNILSLQRTIGNRAVQSLIQRASGNRLYVGNLSFSTSSESVQALFSQAGEVREISLPTDRETGQPRGFAFVTMGSAQAAADAISQLNGQMLDGRSLKVNEAQERPSGGGGGTGGGSRGGGGGSRGGGGGRGRY